jgi:hypothetical protein
MVENSGDLRTRARLLEEIQTREAAIAAAIANSALNQDLLNRYLAVQEERTKNAAKQLKEINQQRLNGAASAEREASSLSGIYKNLNKLEVDRIAQTQKSNTLTQEQVGKVDKLASINRDIAKLSLEDVQQRSALLNEYRDIEDSIGAISAQDQAILDNLKLQNSLAETYANMTESQKEQLEAQLKVYDDIKKTIGGILDTASILTSGPAGLLGMSLIGAGKFVGKLGEVRGQLGGLTEFGTTALAFLDENAVDNAKELAAQFGGMNNVSGELQASISLISTNMGISGVEAASLAGSFARLNDGSSETALNLTKATQEFAAQNGIIPSELMKDLAGSAEEFALFGKDGGKNLIEAGAAAKKMGVDLKTMTGIADNLLDFETSITKELELGALMGKNINLDKARQLAFSGDITGATEETLKALGGIEAFNKMDYYQKKASADLLGVSVAELQKMVSAEEEAARMAGTIGGKFSLLGETIDAGLNKYLGTSLQALGGMVMAGAQLGGSFSQMGFDVKGMASKIPIIGKLFGGGAAPGGPPTPPVPGGPPPPGGPPDIVPDTSIGDKLKSLAEGLKEMGNAKVLFGALNLIPTAAGLALMVIGIPSLMAIGAFGTNAGLGLEFLGVGLQAMGNGAAFFGALTLSAAAVGFTLMTAGVIGLAGVALLGAAAGTGLSALGIGLASFGATAGTVGWLGVAVILALAGAFVAFGFGLNLMTPAIEAIGNAITNIIGSIATGISTIIGSITTMMQTLLPLFTLENAAGLLAMAGGFAALSLSLMGFALASIMAIPGMIAVGAFVALGGGELLGGGGDGEGGGGSDMDALISEIKGLRADLTSGKIGVNMDGASVTARVSSHVDKSNKNSYAK